MWVVAWVGVVPALILLIPSSIPHPHPCQGMMEVLPDRCVPIAKRELLWAGSAGLACWLAGVIFIDRKRTGDAISVMSEVAQTLLTQDVSPPVMGIGGLGSKWLQTPDNQCCVLMAASDPPLSLRCESGFFLKERETTTVLCCPSNVAPSTLQSRPR